MIDMTGDITCQALCVVFPMCPFVGKQTFVILSGDLTKPIRGI